MFYYFDTLRILWKKNSKFIWKNWKNKWIKQRRKTNSHCIYQKINREKLRKVMELIQWAILRKLCRILEPCTLRIHFTKLFLFYSYSFQYIFKSEYCSETIFTVIIGITEIILIQNSQYAFIKSDVNIRKWN